MKINIALIAVINYWLLAVRIKKQIHFSAAMIVSAHLTVVHQKQLLKL
jgi:hypothetical protein